MTVKVRGYPEKPNPQPFFSRLFTGHDPTRGSGQVVFKTPRVGSGRVGSRGFEISRADLSPVKRLRNLTGRVGSGQEVLKSRGSRRVGSGQKVLKSRGSGRVRSTGVEISRFGSGHDPRDMYGSCHGSGLFEPRVAFF